MATGVLVLGVERGTRLLGHLALRDKDYDATVRLGSSTVTDDAEGEVVSRADASVLAAVGDSAILAACAAQRGVVHQRPSAVSAIKVDGQRAYARVRAGEDVQLPAREVHIERLEVRDIRRSADAIDVDIAVTCSTGTYVRAIARDAGETLGVGGHLTALRRTRVGPFTLAQAVAPDDAATGLQGLDTAVPSCFPVIDLDDTCAADVRVGRPMVWPGGDLDTGPHALRDATGRVLALAERDGARLHYLVVLSPSQADADG